MSSSFQPRRTIRTMTFWLLLLVGAAASAAGMLGPAGMRAQKAALERELDQSPYGRPLVLQSQEAGRRAEGDVYAVLAHPFAAVSSALADSGQLVRNPDPAPEHQALPYRPGRGATRVEVRVGKKHEEPIKSASPARPSSWRPTTRRGSTSAWRWVRPTGRWTRAITADRRGGAHGWRTHLPAHGLRLQLWRGQHLAMNVYLRTVARDKVGFTRRQPDRPRGRHARRGRAKHHALLPRHRAIPRLVAGAAAAAARAPARRWFDATEHYPRQLHELDREEYLRMKRNEVRRQNGLR